MKAGELVGEADIRTSTSLPSSSALRFRLVFCCTGVDTIQSAYRLLSENVGGKR